MLDKTLRARVNRLSHAAGITHAANVRTRLCADLEALRKDGAGYDAMVKRIEAYEAAPLPAVEVIVPSCVLIDV